MTTCDNLPTHQISESGRPLCREHASRAKREGAPVEIRPAPEPGGRRKPGPITCQYAEPEETAGEPEPVAGPNESGGLSAGGG